jgi:trimeric autotransporter adhesin
MNINRRTLAAASAVLTLAAVVAQASPMGTAFTYQGRLCDGGVPANGLYDFTFELYNAPEPPGGYIDVRTLTAVPVTNGLFTTNIDFTGGPFAGEARWLKIYARSNGVGAYAELGPRQELKPTPYALYAGSAATAASAATASSVPWSGLTGVPPTLWDGVDNDTTYTAGPGLTLVGTVFSVDINFLNGRYWTLAGNAGTTAGTHFVGTTDDEALELKVNRVRALRVEPTSDGLNVRPNLNGGAPDNSIVASHGSSIGGGWSNTITNASAAFLGGGNINAIRNSEQASIGGGTGNDIERSIGAAIAGGANNDIGADSIYSFVGGGAGNKIATNSMHAAIAGGYINDIGASAPRSFIGGGYDNNIGASSLYAAIVGGRGNDMGTNTDSSFIGGGYDNNVGPNSTYATIVGGYLNDMGTNSGYGFIGGGYDNDIGANSSYATIAGGSGNDIGAYSIYTTIAGGSANDMGTNTDYSFLGGGYDNDIAPNSSYSAITGGSGNDIGTNSDYSFVGGGYHNNVAAEVAYATIAGGYQNTVATDADYASIPGGRQAKAVDYGQFAYASGQFGAQGDAQASMFVLRRTTTSATPAPLYLDGVSRQITVRTNSTVAFDILVVGRSIPGGDFWEAISVAYQLRGFVESEGSGTVVRGVSKIWSYEVEDPTLDATVETDVGSHLRVMVTGAAYQIRWVAHVRTVEVINP